jgi:hypothetical protein
MASTFTQLRPHPYSVVHLLPTGPSYKDALRIVTCTKGIHMEKSKRADLIKTISDGLAVGADAVSGLPVVSSAIALLNVKDTFRDKILLSKLEKFVSGVGPMSPKEKEQMALRLHDPDEARRIGEMLLLTLDNLTEMDKATMLGEIFAAFVRNTLDAEQLRRLIRAVDVAFLDDLNEFVRLGAKAKLELSHPVGAKLANAGLVDASAPSSGGYGGGGGGMNYLMTPLGEAFLCVYPLNDADDHRNP